uniref:Integrase catalytic domain-containing protein n=1 Tax=Cyprinus carpio TaxID=7962 RepID=A0A8C2FEK8_CYPCA
MSRDIQKFCAECVSCQSCASTTPHERAPLQSIHAERPFQRIAADITELPVTSLGNRYVLVVMDYFTRFVNLYPLKDQRATTVAQCIFEDYIKQHGVPEIIHTDQGRQFESDLIKHLCRQLGIEKTRTSPYHAQCDGMVERLNRTLKDQLAKYICESGGEWDKYLPQVELAYNSSIHSSTGFSPFFLAHGREPRLPADILLNYSPAVTSYTPGTPADYAHDVTMRLSYAFKDAAVRSTAAKLNQKRQYDKKTFFHPHKPGDIVFLDDPAQKQNKLAPKWKGPYKILRRMDKDNSPGVTYEITDPRNPQSRRWVVHHNRLKPYRGPWRELPRNKDVSLLSREDCNLMLNW